MVKFNRLLCLVYASLILCSCAGTAGDINSKVAYPLQGANIAKFGNVGDVFSIPKTSHPDGDYFHPVYIFSQGLAHYNHFYLTGDDDSLQVFNTIVEWALANLDAADDASGNKVCAWFYTNPLLGSGYRQLGSRWPSAMAQGYGLALLALAYQERKDESLLDRGACVLRSFEVNDPSIGGVYDDTLPFYWADEYTSNPRRHVLNGYIFAIAGIDVYFRVSKDPRAENLLNAAIGSVDQALPMFFAPFNTFYDANTIIGKKSRSFALYPGYHELHLSQLAYLCVTANSLNICSYLRHLVDNTVGSYGSVIGEGNVKPVIDQVSRPIDSAGHGSARLFDGNWVYGYYSTKGGLAEISAKFAGSVPVRRIVIFEVGHQDTCPQVNFLTRAGEDSTPLVCSDSYQHETGVHKTTAWIFTTSDTVDVTDFSLSFSRHRAAVIALREIALLGPREGDYLQLFKKTESTMANYGY